MKISKIFEFQEKTKPRFFDIFRKIKSNFYEQIVGKIHNEQFRSNSTVVMATYTCIWNCTRSYITCSAHLRSITVILRTVICTLSALQNLKWFLQRDFTLLKMRSTLSTKRPKRDVSDVFLLQRPSLPKVTAIEICSLDKLQYWYNAILYMQEGLGLYS